MSYKFLRELNSKNINEYNWDYNKYIENWSMIDEVLHGDCMVTTLKTKQS